MVRHETKAAQNENDQIKSINSLEDESQQHLHNSVSSVCGNRFSRSVSKSRMVGLTDSSLGLSPDTRDVDNTLNHTVSQCNALNTHTHVFVHACTLSTLQRQKISDPLTQWFPTFFWDATLSKRGRKVTPETCFVFLFIILKTIVFNQSFPNHLERPLSIELLSSGWN